MQGWELGKAFQEKRSEFRHEEALRQVGEGAVLMKDVSNEVPACVASSLSSPRTTFPYSHLAHLSNLPSLPLSPYL